MHALGHRLDLVIHPCSEQHAPRAARREEADRRFNQHVNNVDAKLADD
jgi:hypothetical protein